VNIVQQTPSRLFNFAAGPATLPAPVLERAQEGLVNWNDSGLSVLEMPFTGPHFTGILEAARASLARLLQLPENYHVLFMQGGAYGQFAVIPMNLLRGLGSADYAITGHWSARAAAEARKYGTVNVVTDTSASGFRTLPPVSDWNLDPGAAYCHITTNETANGIQFRQLPDTGDVPLVADATSDFLTKPVDVSRFGAIYASAQKNIGPAGLTIVIVRNDLLGGASPVTPNVFDFGLLAAENSKVNTPPTWAIFLAGLVFDWILAEGGLEEMGERNRTKARILYDAIDASDFYRCPAAENCRSSVSVVFGLPSKGLEAALLDQATRSGLLNLAGHSASGGIRASLYNAITEEAVLALVNFMNEFATRHKSQVGF
jgi:phosphoserine aminotransferase